MHELTSHRYPLSSEKVNLPLRREDPRVGEVVLPRVGSRVVPA